MSLRRRSLRLRLTIAVSAVLGLSLGIFSFVLQETFGQALWRQFDKHLAEDAHALANIVEERAPGPWEIESGSVEDLARWRGPIHFELWMDDGSVLVRSPSLGAADLPRAAAGDGTVFANLVLPDGRAGRLLQTALPPRKDESGPARPSGRCLIVVVARPVAEILATLATLRLLLLSLGGGTLVLAALATVLAIRGGMRPFDRLSARVDAIDAHRLGERLPLEKLPGELQPMVVKLNELLERLEQAFIREHEFSADVSHELRTPLAGLRTTLEVVSSRERSPAEYRVAIDQALAIVRATSSLVEDLLLLARLDARQVEACEEPILLRELVEECLATLGARAQERRLVVDNRVPHETMIDLDREKVKLVIGNLVSNAVEYTAEEGRVVVQSDPVRGLVIEVYDSGPPLPTPALERIFDRFFRLDPSRSGSGEHCGIGLALVRALCGAMGCTVTAENTADGGVAFMVSRDTFR